MSYSNTPPYEADGRQDMAAVFPLGLGVGRWPVIGRTDITLSHQLPGKPVEGHAAHCPFDKNNH